jgi:phosphohistidine phosphatase
VDVYLMQHGESKSKEEDPERPLTDGGRASVVRVAAHAMRVGVRLKRVYHSGILRARQTAELLAQPLDAEGQVEQREGLEPNDPVEPIAQWLLRESASTPESTIALVGHMPFMDKLASRLVAGDDSVEVVAFQMGGLVKLVPKQQHEGFAVAWVLAPELVEA